MKEVIIWSRLGCPACRYAKMFFMEKKFFYEERVIGDGWTQQDFNEAVPNARTVPQIFIDGNHIGGYTDLLEYSRTNKL